MKTPCLLVLLALTMLHCPLSAQVEVQPLPDRSAAPMGRSDLQLEFVYVKDAVGIFGTIDQLYGRQIQLIEDGVGRRIQNLMLLGDTIVIHEFAANVKEIKIGIERLRQTAKTNNPETTLVRAAVKPTHISVRESMQALGSLARLRGEAKGQPSYHNVTVIESQGTILLHDTAANVADMQKIIALVDTPRTQVMIRCRIVQGSDEAKDIDQDLDQLLPQEMKELTRFEHFRNLATGAIRTSTGEGSRIQMAMSGRDGISAQLEIAAGGFNAENKTLRIDRLDLNYAGPRMAELIREQQNLQTATTLPAGEIVVVGALGANPIFVVLEMSVLSN